MNLPVLMFRYRGYTPLPFLIVMIFFAQPSMASLVSGFFVVLVGERLRLWGVLAAGGETRTTGAFKCNSLVTYGPFAFVRNPLYIGNILIYAGFGIMAMALHPWLLAIAMTWFCVQYTLIITSEEKYLRERFGEEYNRYCTHVRRFIPRWSAYNPEKHVVERVKTNNGIGSERRTLQAIGLVTLVMVLVYVL